MAVRRTLSTLVAVGLLFAVALAGQTRQAAPRVQPRPLKVLLVGDDREPHPSAALYGVLAPALARRGIQVTRVMTTQEALDAARLANYDAILFYGDPVFTDAAQEAALKAFVAGGKGIVAMHSSTSSLSGGKMQVSGGAEFRGEIVQREHPVMKGLPPFPAWEENFAPGQPAADRTVLMERVEGSQREAVAWARSEGKGHVFSTTLGHDKRTWDQTGFQKMIEQALRWSVDEQAQQAWDGLKMPTLVWVDGFNVPNYEQRNPAPQYQLPLTPQESMKYIQTPADFKVDLFASEPDIVKPISFSFDERGRLWVIEALDYPNTVLNGAPGNDRIKICEDTNGDGRADKFTIFADHLNMPTSLAFANGGIVVTATPNILFLKDTDGDGKADVRQVLSTGWGIADTHAQPS